MDQVNLPATHVSAGREYLGAVRALGLRPDGLFWGQWADAADWSLLLVTHLYDRIGPLKIADLLIRAYNAGRLVKDISPFVVELHSPDHATVRDLMQQAGRERGGGLSAYGVGGSMHHPDSDRISIQAGDLKVPMSGLYLLEARQIAPMDSQREWKHFKRSVEAIAA